VIKDDNSISEVVGFLVLGIRNRLISKGARVGWSTLTASPSRDYLAFSWLPPHFEPILTAFFGAIPVRSFFVKIYL
jgi:hypothetical protein